MNVILEGILLQSQQTALGIKCCSIRERDKVVYQSQNAY